MFTTVPSGCCLQPDESNLDPHILLPANPSILILSSRLQLCPSNGILPSVSLAKILYAFIQLFRNVVVNVIRRQMHDEK